MQGTPKDLRKDRRRGLIALAIVVAVALGAWLTAEPLIPRQITFLAGPAGSSNHTNALRYAEFMRGHGVNAVVVETRGSVDNLEQLAGAQDASTVALAEAGIEVLIEGFDTSTLVSLGSVQVVPFWLFVRNEVEFGLERDLRGRLVVPGQPGSAILAVVKILLRANDMPEDIISSSLSNVPAERTLEVLESGEADAAFIIGAPGSPEIDDLLSSDKVRPLSFERAEAYDRRYDRLRAVTLPRGAFDLGRDIPARDLRLLGASVQLVACERLSPMLVDLMLDAAREVHRPSTLFSARGEFPTPDGVSLRLSPAAERFYDEGPSPLRAWLPFWAATAVNRFALTAASVLGIAITLFKILPALLSGWFNMWLARIFRRMERIERKLDTAPDRAAMLNEIDALFREADGRRVPRAELLPFFDMRQHLHDLRTRVEQLPE